LRLVTRGDLDGLTCAVVITTTEDIDEIVLIHPQDITDKRFAVTEDDILANLPYHPAVGKWFDHHILTDSNEKPPMKFEGAYALAPSAARVVYDYYRPKHPGLSKYAELVDETDRLDAAQLTREDVLDPQDYILVGYTLDPRTGLGDFQTYFKKLVNDFKTRPIEEIMGLPHVQERVAKIREMDAAFREATERCSRLEGNVVFTDFRSEAKIPVGNRFIVYTLFPTSNVSVRVHWGPSKQHVACAVGHSIFNRTNRVAVGELMSKYRGGGHKGAGTCLLPAETAERDIKDIINALQD
jgi:hypothetical protein